MDWKYVKPLESEDLISEFENSQEIDFPESYKELVKQYNGGRPVKDVFDTDVTKERTIKSLLSFNKEDRETVWKIAEWNKDELKNRFVAFGIDNFGNLICFKTSDLSVVFLDIETLSEEKIADSFSEFLEKLYSI
jgi:hypothetical protein